jgi:hypothetical protein
MTLATKIVLVLAVWSFTAAITATALLVIKEARQGWRHWMVRRECDRAAREWEREQADWRGSWGGDY